MNKYIYAVADLNFPFDINYYVVMARNLKSAQEKVISKYFNDYEWDCPDEWRDFTKYAACEKFYSIGDLKDIETF